MAALRTLLLLALFCAIALLQASLQDRAYLPQPPKLCSELRSRSMPSSISAGRELNTANLPC